jgi:hypothetical protein
VERWGPNMVVILRHDVDEPYVDDPDFNRVTRIFARRLSAFRRRFGSWTPGIPQWNYLHAAERLFEAEESLGIRGTWFFRRVTKPHSSFKNKLLRHGCEVAFHADRTQDERYFEKDLTYTMDGLIALGFSKHGSARNELEAERIRSEIYDPEACLVLAKKYGFRYFSGNGTDPGTPSRLVDNILYFPGAFWMFPGYMDDRKYTLQWLLRNQWDRNMVVLVHPREYTNLFPKVRENLDTFLRHVDEVTSFRDFIEKSAAGFGESR